MCSPTTGYLLQCGDPIELLRIPGVVLLVICKAAYI